MFFSFFLIKIKSFILSAKWSSGGYDKEEKAARAYDLAALKYWGPTTHINFPVSFLIEKGFFFRTLYDPQ